MQTTSNTLFSSTQKLNRIVRTPFEFEKIQNKTCDMLFEEMNNTHTENTIESVEFNAKLSPLTAFAVFIADIGAK